MRVGGVGGDHDLLVVVHADEVARGADQRLVAVADQLGESVRGVEVEHRRGIRAAQHRVEEEAIVVEVDAFGGGDVLVTIGRGHEIGDQVGRRHRQARTSRPHRRDREPVGEVEVVRRGNRGA